VLKNTVCAGKPGILSIQSREATNGGADMRVKVVLRCNECKQRNYNTMKNKKNTPEKLELNKYCRFCRKHTVHSETK
jgi:large subunit ribosomal protein L33